MDIVVSASALSVRQGTVVGPLLFASQRVH